MLRFCANVSWLFREVPFLERPEAASQVRRLGPLAPVLAHLLPQTRRVWPECPALRRAAPGAWPQPAGLYKVDRYSRSYRAL